MNIVLWRFAGLPYGSFCSQIWSFLALSRCDWLKKEFWLIWLFSEILVQLVKKTGSFGEKLALLKKTGSFAFKENAKKRAKPRILRYPWPNKNNFIFLESMRNIINLTVVTLSAKSLKSSWYWGLNPLGESPFSAWLWRRSGEHAPIIKLQH